MLGVLSLVPKSTDVHFGEKVCIFLVTGTSVLLGSMPLWQNVPEESAFTVSQAGVLPCSHGGLPVHSIAGPRAGHVVLKGQGGSLSCCGVNTGAPTMAGVAYRQGLPGRARVAATCTGGGYTPGHLCGQSTPLAMGRKGQEGTEH